MERPSDAIRGVRAAGRHGWRPVAAVPEGTWWAFPDWRPRMPRAVLTQIQNVENSCSAAAAEAIDGMGATAAGHDESRQ